jgi:hypothetical protein
MVRSGSSSSALKEKVGAFSRGFRVDALLQFSAGGYCMQTEPGGER